MTRSSRAVASPRVVSIEDFRPIARQRVPKPVFDYLDGGAEGEVTLRENCRVFNDVTFRPRYAVALPSCDLRTRVLGFDLSLPILLLHLSGIAALCILEAKWRPHELLAGLALVMLSRRFLDTNWKT